MRFLALIMLLVFTLLAIGAAPGAEMIDCPACLSPHGLLGLCLGLLVGAAALGVLAALGRPVLAGLFPTRDPVSLFVYRPPRLA